METRTTYLLTLLPQLPALGETPPLALADALRLLRQQGGADLELLADLLEAEPLLREALEEWVVNPSGSRTVPGDLPSPVRELFDEDLVRGLAEEAWVDAVWQAWFDLLSETGRRHGYGLLSRWAAWEASLRRQLARRRAQVRGDRDEPGEVPPPDVDPVMEAALAAWSAAQLRDAAAGRLDAAMEAEVSLDRARLAYLEGEAPRYTFALDELVSYLLRLRLLERHRLLDRSRGRTLLKEVSAL